MPKSANTLKSKPQKVTRNGNSKSTALKKSAAAAKLDGFLNDLRLPALRYWKKADLHARFCTNIDIYEQVAGYLGYHVAPQNNSKSTLATSTAAAYFGGIVEFLKSEFKGDNFWSTETLNELSQIRRNIEPQVTRYCITNNIEIKRKKTTGLTREEVSAINDSYLRCGEYN